MLNKYLNQFSNLHCNKLKGEIAPHKPIMLLSVMDLIEAGFITRPRAGVYQINHLVSQTDIAKSIYQKSFLANNPTLSEDYHFSNHFYFEFVG